MVTNNLKAPAWNILECQASSAVANAIPANSLETVSDGSCPLFGAPDSGTHVLGACTYKMVKGLHIE